MDLVTTFPWYDDRSKQNRWKAWCDKNCAFKLITDRRSLLPFMFRRLHSCQPATDWILRCPDVEQPCQTVLSNGDFSSGADWTLDDISIGSGTAGAGANVTGSLTQVVGLNAGQCYNYSIEIVNIGGGNGGGTVVWLEVGGTETDEFDTIGVHSGTITPTTNTTLIIHVETKKTFGSIVIDNVVLCPCFSVGEDDVVLPVGQLQVTTIVIDGVQWDYFYYCGGDLNMDLPCGTYESIINAGGTYYSELITVKDFDAITSPYLLLEWYNSCDLGGIYYNDCFFNRLWLDAVIAEPSYPIEEEVKTNGENKTIPTFQKWQKVRQVQTAEVPEYLVDALTLMKLHDHVSITYPLRESAVQVDAAVEIDQVVPRINWLFTGCYANVIVDFIVDEVVIDSACCDNMQELACLVPNFSVIDSVCQDDMEADGALLVGDEFDDDSLWDNDGTGNKWDINTSHANFNDAGAGSNILKRTTPPALVPGATYRVEFEIDAISGSFVQARVGGNFGSTFSTAGVHTDDIVCGVSGEFELFANLGTCALQYVTLRRVYVIGDQYLVFTDCDTKEGQVWTWNGSGWDTTSNVSGDIVQVENETSGVWWVYNGDFWTNVPLLYDSHTLSETEFFTKFQIMDDTCATIELSKLNSTHGFSPVGGTYTQQDGVNGVTISASLPPCEEEVHTYWIRVRMWNFNCDYGVSDPVELETLCP